MPKRKRKPIRFLVWFYRLLSVSMAVIIAALFGLSAVELWRWGVLRPAPTATPLPPVRVSYSSPVPLPTSSPIPPRYVQTLTDAVYLVANGHLGMYSNGTITAAYSNTWPTATAVGLSPNHRQLAYLQGGTLHLAELPSGAERTIAVGEGPIVTFAWSPDGNTLSFVAQGNGKQVLYRTASTSIYPILQLAVPSFAAPPVWHPSTHRILYAVLNGTQTSLYTIDGNCESPDECAQSRQEFMTLPFYTDWLDFHPSGLYIVVTNATNGVLSLISTADRQLQPILNDTTYKHEPMFSPDGSKLLFLNPQHLIHVADLQTMTETPLYDLNGQNVQADSISWK